MKLAHTNRKRLVSINGTEPAAAVITQKELDLVAELQISLWLVEKQARRPSRNSTRVSALVPRSSLVIFEFDDGIQRAVPKAMVGWKGRPHSW